MKKILILLIATVILPSCENPFSDGCDTVELQIGEMVMPDTISYHEPLLFDLRIGYTHGEGEYKFIGTFLIPNAAGGRLIAIGKEKCCDCWLNTSPWISWEKATVHPYRRGLFIIEAIDPIFPSNTVVDTVYVK